MASDCVGLSGFQAEYERKFSVMCYEKVRITQEWVKSSQMRKTEDSSHHFIWCVSFYSVQTLFNHCMLQSDVTESPQKLPPYMPWFVMT